MKLSIRNLAAAGSLLALLMVAAAAPAARAQEAPEAGRPLAVHVKGNHLINQNGKILRLFGVDRTGQEYACIQDWGFFSGPVSASAINVIKSWHVNAIRVPLNEDCWLGIKPPPPATGQYVGAPYRAQIVAFVQRINRAGLYAILDLHWNAPAGQVADEQQPMADADNSPAFWRSVAATFKKSPAVLFDLYNEPYVTSWSCWLNGCQVSNDKGTWQTAGMKSLIAVVRAAGATQPLMLGGLDYASDLSQWLSHMPADPLRTKAANPIPGQAQLVASYHSYCGPPGTSTVAGCRTEMVRVERGEWPAVANVARRVPVVTGELGEYDCANTYVPSYMKFADTHGISYLGWAWIVDSCGSSPALIKNYQGAPTPFGIGFKSHFAAVNP